MSDMFDSDDYVDMLISQENAEREREKLRKKGVMWIGAFKNQYKESDISDEYLQNIIAWLKKGNEGFSDLLTMQKLTTKRQQEGIE